MSEKTEVVEKTKMERALEWCKRNKGYLIAGGLFLAGVGAVVTGKIHKKQYAVHWSGVVGTPDELIEGFNLLKERYPESVTDQIKLVTDIRVGDKLVWQSAIGESPRH